MGNIDYKYNPYDAAYYAAFSPMSWCTIFAWIIFTTHIGHTSKNSHEIHFIGNINIFFQLFLAIVSNILSCRLFLITTRIAYAVYLTQFPIFFYNVGTTRHSGYYSFIPSMVIIFKYISFLILTLIVLNFFLKGNLWEILCILVISAVLTLLFDTPFQNIKQYLLRRKPINADSSQQKQEITENFKQK